MCLLFISVEPQIAVEPRNGVLIVKEGEPANLKCNVLKGKPAPEVIWRRKARMSFLFFLYFCETGKADGAEYSD